MWFSFKGIPKTGSFPTPGLGHSLGTSKLHGGHVPFQVVSPKWKGHGAVPNPCAPCLETPKLGRRLPASGPEDKTKPDKGTESNKTPRSRLRGSKGNPALPGASELRSGGAATLGDAQMIQIQQDIYIYTHTCEKIYIYICTHACMRVISK